MSTEIVALLIEESEWIEAHYYDEDSRYRLVPCACSEPTCRCHDLADVWEEPDGRTSIICGCCMADCPDVHGSQVIGLIEPARGSNDIDIRAEYDFSDARPNPYQVR